MQYLITPLLEVLNPTNTVSRNRLLSFAIGNMEAEIYNCLIAKHVYCGAWLSAEAAKVCDQ